MPLKKFLQKIFYRKLENNAKHVVETANVSEKLIDEIMEHAKHINITTYK